MSVVGFILKFLDKTGNQRNLEITDNPDGEYRLSVRERGALESSSNSISLLNPLSTQVMINETMVSERYLSGINVSGNADGVFQIFVNSDLIYERRTTIGSPSFFDVFPSMKYLSSGDIVRVDVTNCGRSDGDFFASIYYNG